MRKAIDKANDYLMRWGNPDAACSIGDAIEIIELLKDEYEELEAQFETERATERDEIEKCNAEIGDMQTTILCLREKCQVLEKEKAELEERLNRQAKTISEYIDERKEWEKENEILRCIKQSWINRAEEENAKAERLEKEKAELEKEANKRLWAINEIHAQNSRLRCQEAQNLRDKFAMAALQGLVGRPEVNDPELGIGMDELVDDAFRFAALCMEARKK